MAIQDEKPLSRLYGFSQLALDALLVNASCKCMIRQRPLVQLYSHHILTHMTQHWMFRCR